ncbi:hypothetical protein GHK52_09670 [Lactococcus garvieae]|nr:hypothetical protein [Lactococcus garvieae]
MVTYLLTYLLTKFSRGQYFLSCHNFPECKHIEKGIKNDL